MTQENKDLLLKDLCARLPYKPIVQIDDCGIWNLRGVDHDDSAELRDRVIVWHEENYSSFKSSFPIIDCKPYLFPLSSMTEEQEKEIQEIVGNSDNACIIRKTDGLELWLDSIDTDPTIWLDTIFEVQDYLNKNHFDYRNLINKNLAIDCTNLNIY